MPVYALFNLSDPDATAVDSAHESGTQYGIYLNGATSSGGQAVLDGANDLVKIYPDPLYQMGLGTLEIRFTLSDCTQAETQTVLSRDSTGETDGGFRVEVLPDGTVRVSHETATGTEVTQTAPGFASPGDTITLTYSWNEGEGGNLDLVNETSGESFEAEVSGDLTMDMGTINQPWMIGAGQAGSDARTLQNVDQHFAGSVDYFSLSDTVDNGPDGIVRGTTGGDLIDFAYTGDPDGDRIDANDAIIVGDAPQDDRVKAGDGNDTIRAGEGHDTIEGEADRDLIQGAHEGDVVDGGEAGDDHDTLDLTGAGPLRVIYDPSNAENGSVEFLDGDRNVTGTLTFSNIEAIVPCFTPGTLIATPRGEVPVECLRPGDRIVTRDNGLQEIRWIGQKTLGWADLIANPHLKPVLVPQGSLGHGLPERDMLVSPNHRLLVANDRTALYFDEHEVLVAAKHLTAARGPHSVDAAGVTYVHFMCDRHEVVLSNGAWSESFQPGDYTLKGMGNSQRSEIFELFPELRTVQGLDGYIAARKTLRRHEAALLRR